MSKNMALYLSVALLLSGLITTNIVHIVYADSSTDQLVGKFVKKCGKATNEKKADQSAEQFERHVERFGQGDAQCDIGR